MASCCWCHTSPRGQCRLDIWAKIKPEVVFTRYCVAATCISWHVWHHLVRWAAGGGSACLRFFRRPIPRNAGNYGLLNWWHTDHVVLCYHVLRSWSFGFCLGPRLHASPLLSLSHLPDNLIKYLLCAGNCHRPWQSSGSQKPLKLPSGLDYF